MDTETYVWRNYTASLVTRQNKYDTTELCMMDDNPYFIQKCR